MQTHLLELATHKSHKKHHEHCGIVSVSSHANVRDLFVLERSRPVSLEAGVLEKTSRKV